MAVDQMQIFGSSVSVTGEHFRYGAQRPVVRLVLNNYISGRALLRQRQS
jgi:hypothetical protein